MASLVKLPRELLLDIAERIRDDAPAKADIMEWDERHAQNQKSLTSMSCVCKGLRDSLFDKVFRSVVVSSPGALLSLLGLLHDRPEIRDKILRLRLRVPPSKVEDDDPSVDISEMQAIGTWALEWGIQMSLDFMNDNDFVEARRADRWLKYDWVDETCISFSARLLLCLLPRVRDVLLSTNCGVFDDVFQELTWAHGYESLEEAPDGSSADVVNRRILPDLCSLNFLNTHMNERLDREELRYPTSSERALSIATVSRAVSEVHLNGLYLFDNTLVDEINCDHISRLSLVNVEFNSGQEGFTNFVQCFKNLSTFMFFTCNPHDRNEQLHESFITPRQAIEGLGAISIGIRTLCLKVYRPGFDDGDFCIQTLEDFISLENLYIDAEALAVSRLSGRFHQHSNSDEQEGDEDNESGDEDADEKDEKDGECDKYDERCLFCRCDEREPWEKALYRCKAIDTLPLSVKRLHIPESDYPTSLTFHRVSQMEHSLSRLVSGGRPGMALEELAVDCCFEGSCEGDRETFERSGIRHTLWADEDPEAW
ncbi:hypothetical protein CPLU01_09517 [Colletotrichum plurivorum]|uniref:Uncharacterized protein n=1 Tax=Colletotrichum plurivorum TaxID=2175906 RepID=A0A8H6K7U9_9PEZI|nr:hypothetical protein CPLU01_09517 [Colletotrichum plurivorum]